MTTDVNVNSYVSREEMNSGMSAPGALQITILHCEQWHVFEPHSVKHFDYYSYHFEARTLYRH